MKEGSSQHYQSQYHLEQDSLAELMNLEMSDWLFLLVLLAFGEMKEEKSWTGVSCPHKLLSEACYRLYGHSVGKKHTWWVWTVL